MYRYVILNFYNSDPVQTDPEGFELPATEIIPVGKFLKSILLE